ncbi:MAG: 30S ribosomal protein S6 [Thermovirgaceae bacterium]
MRPYELMMILEPELEEHQAHIDEVQEVVRNLGGEIEKVNVWGKRRFAYPIQKLTEGHYSVFSFKMEPDKVSEVERILRLKQQVLRHMVTLLDES